MKATRARKRGPESSSETDFLPFSEGPATPSAHVPDFAFEREAWASGHARVAGVDEVGRGALAGPVVAAAVVLDSENVPPGLNDSKKLSAARREHLAAAIHERALAVAIARVEAAEIDRINILQATLKAMRAAIGEISPAVDFVLIDGSTPLPKYDGGQKTIVAGDARSLSIAAASIVAKVARDRLMLDFDEVWPGYGFRTNVGYGTKVHLLALERLGASPIHRMTFRGVSA